MKRVLLLALVAGAACDSTPILGSPDPDPRVAFAGTSAISEWNLFVVARPDLERYWSSGRKTALDDARFRIVHRYGLEAVANSR